VARGAAMNNNNDTPSWDITAHNLIRVSNRSKTPPVKYGLDKEVNSL